jgi:hypothetical protein
MTEDKVKQQLVPFESGFEEMNRGICSSQ